MTKKRIYLANPCGFSSLEKWYVLPLIRARLEGLGAEVWEPFERNNQVDFSDPGLWAFTIGQADKRDVEDCDAVFAVVNGCLPDDGVAIEVGMAIALGKPVFLYRDDFRRCCDGGKYPLNLMWFTGHPREGWERYYYASIDELGDKDKALRRFLSGESTCTSGNPCLDVESCNSCKTFPSGTGG